MLAALLATLLTQAGPLPAPPLPPAAADAAPSAAASSSTSATPPSAAPGAQPSPTGAPTPKTWTIEFADRHLVSLDVGMTGFKLRDSQRTWSLGDGLAEAFTLIPEAAQLGEKADREYGVTQGLLVASLSVCGVGLLAIALAPVVATTVSAMVTMLGVGLVASLVGLVLALVALPYSAMAQQHALDAVSVFNHGLVRGIEVPRPAVPMPVPLAWVPRSDVEVFVE